MNTQQVATLFVAGVTVTVITACGGVGVGSPPTQKAAIQAQAPTPPPPAPSPAPPPPAQGWISQSTVCAQVLPDTQQRQGQLNYPLTCGEYNPFVPPPLAVQPSAEPTLQAFPMDHILGGWPYGGICNGVPCGIVVDPTGALTAQDANGCIYSSPAVFGDATLQKPFAVASVSSTCREPVTALMFRAPTRDQAGAFTYATQAFIAMGEGLLIYSVQPQTTAQGCYLTYSVGPDGALVPTRNYVNVDVTIQLVTVTPGGPAYVPPAC